MTVSEMLVALRAQKPLIQCLTNSVVENFTANALLAAGAAPAMIHDPVEAGEFAAFADATLVNVGTVTHEQAEAMRKAVATCNAQGRPWVLDPVAVGALSLRTAVANELKLQHPALIRGNASEIKALAGEASKSRGVESGDATEAAVDAGRRLAAETGAVVLITGETDYVLSPDGVVEAIRGGSELMQYVTGMGCAQGAFAAAVLAVVKDPFEAAKLTAEAWAAAGALAAQGNAHAIGNFQIAFLNALSAR